MVTAEEERSADGSAERPRRGLTLRHLTLFLVAGAVFVALLTVYKRHRVDEFSRECVEALASRHPVFRNLFQASFYFFYDEQFLPGVAKTIESTPDLERVRILTSRGAVLFDSTRPARDASSRDREETLGEPEIAAKLGEESPTVFVHGFQVQVLMPAGQYALLYAFHAAPLRNRVVIFLVVGLLACAAGVYVSSRVPLGAAASVAGRAWVAFWGLRTKFLATIVLVNVITGGIVFFTLSELQTREQTERIQRESLLFSQFSTDKVVADFSNYFYFYYQDKFLPSIKSIIATNENLVGVRIISNRTRSVLFDSEIAASGPVPTQTEDTEKVKYPEDIEGALRTRGFVTRFVKREGERYLSVLNSYRNENQETLFFVEYVFSFHTLYQSIQAIRSQILLDLVPSMAIGLVIAALFAQLLISPIRKLVRALNRVTEGDYEATVDIRRSDEVGELVDTFNTMTLELRKKKELRKYLSDTTYRQVMEGADTPEGVRLGGQRVPAAVLFSDIRDFVHHCETQDAEEVTSMLNDYFTEMVEIVYRHGGEVDKFIGDAILAVFYATEEPRTIRPAEAQGGPSPTATSLQAVYCALEMQERLKEFNRKRSGEQKSTIEVGIGINYGEIISGPIGSKDRKDFTIIGDVVNLANRIEKLSKGGKHSHIVFSHEVEEKVRGLLEYVELTDVKIRGKDEPVKVYELVRVKDIETLLGNLREGDPELRRRSVELLGQSRNAEAIPSVLRVLEDADEGMRLRAVAALAKLAPPDHPETLDALFARVRTERSPKVLASLVASIGRICTTERILELAPLLEDSDERIVANVIEALGQARSPRCTDLILPKLGSRNNRIKANAAMALFAAGKVEVIDTLKPMLMHSDALMRSSAAFAIGELTTLAQAETLLAAWKEAGREVKMFLAELQECVPMLVSLLKDRDPMVKRQAVIALGKIRDRSAVLPIIDNVDFEHDSKDLVRDVSRALRAIGSHKLVREVLDRFS